MIEYEMTDTFGGEANYCWVRRGELDIDPGTSTLAIVRQVKQALGLSGVRCTLDYDSGSQLRYNINGAAICFFITFV